MGERSPDLNEVMGNHFEYSMKGVHTAIPAVVVSVEDLGSQRINVQPSISLRSQDGLETSQRPPILNVPLGMPLTKKGGLSLPIQAGDCVFLIFSMRGLEIWKRGDGKPQIPSDIRMFDRRDCIALPGIYPFNESPNKGRSLSHSTEDVVLVHNIGSGRETEIRLKPNGDVIVNSPSKVEVNCQEAEINASSSTNINTGDFNITSDSFIVNTGVYALSATTSASQTATINMNGSFILNGTPIESHSHGGIQPGGGRTDNFGS